MTKAGIGRVLLTVIALFTVVSSDLADWNVTHIYHPHWPPRAKFHNGQTMSVAVIGGSAALWFPWRRSGDFMTHLKAALLFGASKAYGSGGRSQLASFLLVAQAIAPKS